jgi:hypothetical protein
MMTIRRAILISVALIALGIVIQAQTTTKTKEPAGGTVTTSQITGEVVQTDGNWLLARLRPNGEYWFFHVPTGRTAIVDGKAKTLNELRPGTVLTATYITMEQSLTLRTTTVTNGTVWYVSGNYVIVTLENGENREYKVPDSYKFVVNGKPASVSELSKGMKVSATKIVEEPRKEVSNVTIVTGSAPK